MGKCKLYLTGTILMIHSPFVLADQVDPKKETKRGKDEKSYNIRLILVLGTVIAASSFLLGLNSPSVLVVQGFLDFLGNPSLPEKKRQKHIYFG